MLPFESVLIVFLIKKYFRLENADIRKIIELPIRMVWLGRVAKGLGFTTLVGLPSGAGVW